MYILIVLMSFIDSIVQKKKELLKHVMGVWMIITHVLGDDDGKLRARIREKEG